MRDEINRHDYFYFVLNKPVISDQEYDRLYRKLVDLEEAFPELISDDSPTRRISGKPLSGFRPVKHSTKMLSLDNTYSEEEVREFDARVQKLLGREAAYEVSLKVDGVAVALRYREGRLVAGVTRGDGTTGDDVTPNIKTIRAVPLSLITDDLEFMNLEVRAEVFLRRRNFEIINQQKEKAGEPVFANPRNAAAGTLRLLDPKEVARRNLDIFVHTVPAFSGSGYDSHFQLLKRLGQCGLRIIPHIRLCPTIDQVMDEIDRWRARRNELEFDVDGLVIKVDDMGLRLRLGSTIKSPRWAIAYKYPPAQAVTKLVEIQLQVGRTGRITPVAVLAPVLLSGSTISRATLHNEDEIRRKDIRPGDDVVIEKGGEVIPKVIRVLDPGSSRRGPPFCFPRVCPVCREKIYRRSEEADWKCLNSSCPAQIKALVLHFVSRPAMDIAGMGYSLVEQLVDKGMVKSFDELYRLRPEGLAELDRMGQKSAGKIIKSIQASKNRDFAAVLFALGIPGIGIRASHVLAEYFGDIDTIINAEVEEISAIKGIGMVLAENIRNYFNTAMNIRLINSLKKAGLKFSTIAETSQKGAFPGMVFLFTGGLTNLDRTQAQELVRKQGGTVSSSVSKAVDIVVAGSNPGAKYDRAVDLGLKIISEDQFIDMLKKSLKKSLRGSETSEAISELFIK